MRDEKGYRALTCLLRAGLWQESSWEAGIFPLDKTEWENLYVRAGKQAVLGIVWDGICLLPKEWCPSRQLLAKWLLTMERMTERFVAMEERMAEQAKEWDRRGLTAVLLKGHGVADMYPHPAHRTCGDIDWYFPKQQDWETVLHWAEERGEKPETDSDGDVHYTWKDTVVEHHRHWEHLSNPSGRKFLKKLEQEEGYEVWKGMTVLAPLPNLVLLNTHILKHALVLGVGMRQLCDLAMAYRYYEGRYEGQKLKRVWEQLGLLKWTALIHTALVEVIGMPIRYLPYPLENRERTGPLMQQIWKDGNFGMYRDENQPYIEKTTGARMRYVMEAWKEKGTWLWNYAPAEMFWRPIMLLKNRMVRG